MVRKSLFVILAVLLIMSCAAALLVAKPVRAAPSVAFSPRSGAPGTSIMLAGSNFVSYAGDNVVILFEDLASPVASVTVPASGNFQVKFLVPARANPGENLISVRTRTGGILAEDTFTVESPEIRLDTFGGRVGAKVAVTLHGFYANKPVTIHYYLENQDIILSTPIAGENGDAVLNITVPASPQGKHMIAANDDEGHFASAQFEIIPTFFEEPQTVAVGDKASVQGAGFTAGSEITVILNDVKVAYANTSNQGSFVAQFFVPVLRAGKYLVAVETYGGERHWTEITVIPRISMSIMKGEIGANITLTGTGFDVNGIVYIRYDSTVMGATVSDLNGAFTFEFKVPVSLAGPHVVTATDGDNTKQLHYEVESDAPAVPEPVLPKDRERVSLPLKLGWESVYDLSQPLVYSLEIARDKNFTVPVLKETGLTTSEYIIGSEILLPNRRGHYYYWRVRATDGADNAGDWSEVKSFWVKPLDVLPPWARYVLILTQVVIVLGYIFQVKKGLAARKS